MTSLAQGAKPGPRKLLAAAVLLGTVALVVWQVRKNQTVDVRFSLNLHELEVAVPTSGESPAPRVGPEALQHFHFELVQGQTTLLSGDHRFGAEGAPREVLTAPISLQPGSYQLVSHLELRPPRGAPFGTTRVLPVAVEKDETIRLNFR
jgi:hypothetical protein